MNIKPALRDWLYESYSMKNILVISRYAAPPYPASPDFPPPGDRINRSMLSCRDMTPLLSTHSAPSKRGKGGGASHQRGKCISSPAGRLYGFSRQRRHKKWRLWRRTSPAQRYYITPEGESPQPACKAKPITGRTLGAQGQRPGGAINPRPQKRASTFGNTVPAAIREPTADSR